MNIHPKQILGNDGKWFFQLYLEIATSNKSCCPKILSIIETHHADNNAFDVALGLFLLATDTTKHGITLSELNVSLAGPLALCADALSTLMTVQNSCQTVELAILSGGLKKINLYTKLPEITKLTAASKNFAYDNCIQDGSLMSSTQKDLINYDLLLACVPMGLFEPEDLVLVEAIKTLSSSKALEKATENEKSLLAWYWSEQGSYANARSLLQMGNQATAIEKIVILKLFELNQFLSQFISHSPHGNGNRYEPLIEERFPKLVSDKDEVIVRARAHPLSTDDPVELIVDGATIAGRMQTDFWEFKIPAKPAGTIFSYHLQFASKPDVRTADFSYEVLQTKIFKQIHDVTASPDKIVLTGDGFCLLLSVNNDGQMELEAKPAPQRAERTVFAENLTYRLKNYSVRINQNPFSFSILQQDIVQISSTDNCVTWLESTDGQVHQIELSLKSAPAGIYGLGERYNDINQYGNFVDQYVYNQYKDQGLKTYMPMPVFYSDKNIGMHLATHFYTWFDFGQKHQDTIIIGVEAGTLPIHILSGTINQQIKQYIEKTGKPKMLPEWALGPWMSSNNWDSEAEVRYQIDLTKKHQIPATVLVIEAWSDEATFYIFNDATYEENDGNSAHQYTDFEFPEWGRWPNPKDLVEHLHDNDLKCILWQIPIIKQVTSLTHIQKTSDEAALIKNGYGVKNADGSPYRLPEGWFKDSLLLDFTSEAASRWWFAKRQYLLDDLNVDGFKTDGGECVFGNDLTFCDGSDGRGMRNKYPNDYISAYYDFVQQNNGITFSRSGYAGAQAFPAHWAGDENSTWDACKRSMLAGLSAGMSGIIFWGWDLAGFSGPIPSAELYIRSTQMACFCPIMQYHAESKAEFNQDRTPWNIATRTKDDRALSVYRFYANLRMSLMPYMMQEAEHCVKTCTPMMRAMVLDYQGDQIVAQLWDQYFFGRDLLIAPIICEGKTSRKVYLPAGNWWHIFENRWFAHGTHKVHAELEAIPVFARAGALIPLAFDEELHLGGNMPSNIEQPTQIVLLVVGNTHTQAIYNESHDASISISWSDQENININTVGQLKKHYSIVFTNPPKRASLNDNEVADFKLNISGSPLFCVKI